VPKQKLTSPKVKRPIGWSSHAWMVSTPGRMIFVSGLTSRDDKTGAVVHIGDVKAQSEQVFKQLEMILAEGGATLADVVKVTVFLCNRKDFPAFHEARRKAFLKDPPASSAVLVAGLIDERTLVEVEAVAFVAE